MSPSNNSWRPFAPFSKRWRHPSSIRTGFWLQAEQTANQNRFQVDLDASRTDNEELRRDNEKLRRELQCVGERAAGEQSPPIPVKARPIPFSQTIMNVVIPTNFMT